MKVSNIINALNAGLQTISAALSSGEITLEDGIGFGINANGAITLTKNGEVLAVCETEADKDAVKKWADALLKDIADKRSKEETEIREAVDKAKKALEKAEKSLSDKEAKVKAEAEGASSESADEDEAIDLDEDADEDEDEESGTKAKKPVGKKAVAKTVITEYDKKQVEDGKKDLDKAEAALKRLDEEGLVSEQTEAAIKAAKVMADVITAYIEKACCEASFAQAALLPHKTLPRLVRYVYNKARAYAGNSRSCCVPANEVYAWIYEYMLADDKEACDKEDEEERQREIKQRNSSAIEAVKSARRTATSKRKDANAKKAAADKEADADKKAKLLKEYEKLNAEADTLKANAEKLYEELSDEAKELMKNEGKKADKKGSASKTSKKAKEDEEEENVPNIIDIATATAKKAEKADAPEKATTTATKAVKVAKKVEKKAVDPADELPPMQMSIFDLLGA